MYDLLWKLILIDKTFFFSYIKLFIKIPLLKLVKSVWAQVFQVKTQRTTVPSQNCEIEIGFIFGL